ncbi:hypothetical protein Q3G72_002053 [Acer saccharum]|nr:hypothetical protein Q3G72_002053 [Acer saccharum]
MKKKGITKKLNQSISISRRADQSRRKLNSAPKRNNNNKTSDNFNVSVVAEEDEQIEEIADPKPKEIPYCDWLLVEKEMADCHRMRLDQRIADSQQMELELELELEAEMAYRHCMFEDQSPWKDEEFNDWEPNCLGLIAYVHLPGDPVFVLRKISSVAKAAA